ncbi:hypothetical protein FACS1894178_5900 [Bacteroidia bacterium]|nr:hypothetical protein FACS1894178_5900 [Bacteroidia bacterium]
MKKNLFYLAFIAILTVLFSTGCVKPELPGGETGESPVVINEAYSNGGRSTWGDIDWVELYNTSDEAADISGYVLSDKPDKIEKITLPANTIIPAHGFLLVEVDVAGGFGLSSGGDVVYLYNLEEQIVASIEFGALGIDQSIARVPDGSATLVVQQPTPGVTNNNFTVVPSISNVSHNPISPTSDEAVVVSATIVANEGAVIEAKLIFTVNAGNAQEIAMTLSGDVYTGTITAQAVGAEVAYKVRATNSVNGVAETSETEYTVRDAAVVDYTGLVINEIDGNGKFVELYNGSTAEISLAGVMLVKNETGNWWTGGATATIAAGGYYSIQTSGASTILGDDFATGSGNGISPKQILKFQLTKPDGTTELDAFVRTNGVGSWGDAATPQYDTTTPKYSFARCPDGIGAFGLAVPSCSAANPFTPVGPIVTDGGTITHYENIVINEVDGNKKFIELYNKGTEALSIGSLVIMKNISGNDPTLWYTCPDVNIPAGGYYTIAETSTTGLPSEVVLDGGGGISASKTVRFDLLNGAYVVDVFARVKADNVLDTGCSPNYSSTTPKYSFSRCADGGEFGLAVPTPHAANPATAVGPIVTE